MQHLFLKARKLQIQLVAARVLIAGISLFALQTGIQADAADDNITMLADSLYLGNPVVDLS